jgi:hypothetical protein
MRPSSSSQSRRSSRRRFSQFASTHTLEHLESRKLLAEIAAAERKRDPILAGRTKARWKATNRALRARTKIDPKLQRDK